MDSRHIEQRVKSGRRARASILPRVRIDLAAMMLLLLLVIGAPAKAQTRKPRASKPKQETANPVADSKAEVIKAAKDHKANLESNLGFIDGQVKEATAELERKKALFDQGVIARRELEKIEQTLALSHTQQNAVQNEIAQTDSLIAEAVTAEQVAKLAPMRVGGYVTTAALIRYYGAAHWSLSDVSKVEGFFVQRFGRTLPISALGQTAVHDRLGFDHHEAVDVAVHPDSPEGQALIAYLQSAGISFIAFRQAVAGSATGAHIHIGLPSKRLIK